MLDGAWPARIHQALAASPGITKVAQFGRCRWAASRRTTRSTNFDSPYPPVQIYQVAGAAPVATVQPAAARCASTAAPEALLTLADEGLLGGRPVLLNADDPGLPAAASVVTDSLRRRVRNFGELRTKYSPTLTASQPAQTFEAADDYTEPGWTRYQSVARYTGIGNVTASSSAVRHRRHPRPVGERAAAVLRGRRGPADHVGVGQLDRAGRPVDPGQLRRPGRPRRDTGRVHRPARRSARRSPRSR